MSSTSGDERAAARDLAFARQALAEVKNVDLRRRLEADLLITEILISPQPAGGVKILNRIIDLYGQEEDPSFIARLHLASSRSHLAAGNEERAEGVLREGIEQLERRRSSILDESLRISFFEQATRLFDEMILLLAQNPDRIGDALAYVERSRARALLDWLEPTASLEKSNLEPKTYREIRAGIPENVALVEYALAGNRLLIWILRKDGVGLVSVAKSEPELDSLVARLHKIVSDSPAAVLRPVLAPLFDSLVRPVLPWVRPGDQIVFIPEGSLNSVPFAALWDTATRRYLIQDRVVSVAPSASFYLEARKRDAELVGQGAPTALAVGNPSFDRTSFSGLPQLPWAKKEVEAVARLFPGSTVLTDHKATEEAFLAEAGRHEIVHFGGHAEVHPKSPRLSHLVLASDGGSGQLHAYELYWARFNRTRLVTLGACSTASGPSNGEGVLSLARPFLAAGVPSVIASLWRVNDASASELFQVFYEHILQGKDASVALRQAQLALLADPRNSPGDWAVFEMIGAGSPLVQAETLKAAVPAPGATPPAP